MRQTWMAQPVVVFAFRTRILRRHYRFALQHCHCCGEKKKWSSQKNGGGTMVAGFCWYRNIKLIRDIPTLATGCTQHNRISVSKFTFGSQWAARFLVSLASACRTKFSWRAGCSRIREPANLNERRLILDNNTKYIQIIVTSMTLYPELILKNTRTCTNLWLRQNGRCYGNFTPAACGCRGYR